MRAAVAALVMLAACAFDAGGFDFGDDAAGGDGTTSDAAPVPDAQQFDAARLLDATPDAQLDAYSTPDAQLDPDAYQGCEGYSQVGDRWYRVGGPAIWFDARVSCEADGGYLAVISDVTENNVVRTLGGPQAYIGLIDLDFNGAFEWINGDPLDYTNWHETQPDGGAVVVITADGSWYDLDSSGAFNYVCECAEEGS